MEMIVSLAIFGLIVIVILNIFPSSLFATQSASEQIEAENLAQSYLEEARMVSFASLQEGTTTLTPADSKYHVTRVIFAPQGTDSEQTLAVKITVGWDSKGRHRELTREVWLSIVRS